MILLICVVNCKTGVLHKPHVAISKSIKIFNTALVSGAYDNVRELCEYMAQLSQRFSFQASAVALSPPPAFQVAFHSL